MSVTKIKHMCTININVVLDYSYENFSTRIFVIRKFHDTKFPDLRYSEQGISTVINRTLLLSKCSLPGLHTISAAGIH